MRRAVPTLKTNGQQSSYHSQQIPPAISRAAFHLAVGIGNHAEQCSGDVLSNYLKIYSKATVTVYLLA